ncbi:MAG: hypothetical protein H7A37_00985 [Chlamydiales bacterium]|nr:hypothetical protein [Chlamydiia bacterium]MCP5506868.1 hypothetical protein [Chlamydiales bacterium]
MEYYSILLAAIVFAIVGAVHIIRLFSHFNVIIGEFHVPAWLSGVIGVILLFASYFLFMSIL